MFLCRDLLPHCLPTCLPTQTGSDGYEVTRQNHKEPQIDEI